MPSSGQHNSSPELSRAAEIVRRCYLPFMLLAVNGLGIWLSSRHAPEWTILAVLVAAVSCSFVAERIVPYEREWNVDRGDSRRDLAHAGVNELLQLGALLLLPVLVGWFALGSLWPSSWPFVVQVLLAVLVLDAGITFGHYASHRVPVLWRFHAVHHSVKRLYGFNGLMKHPLHQLFETGVATIPLVLLGLPTTVATALVFCVAVQLLVQHSNVDASVGPFRSALAVSEVHRFHHLKWAGVGDVNFGLFTTLWDRMLGTAVWDPARRFDSDDLGIAARPDFPIAYFDELADPFRRYPSNSTGPNGRPTTTSRSK